MSLNFFPACPHNRHLLGDYINTKTPTSLLSYSMFLSGEVKPRCGARTDGAICKALPYWAPDLWNSSRSCFSLMGAYEPIHLCIFQSLDTKWKKKKIICSKRGRGGEFDLGCSHSEQLAQQKMSLCFRTIWNHNPNFHTFSGDFWTTQQVSFNLRAACNTLPASLTATETQNREQECRQNTV